jgi:exodeoxyribonuclease VII small subunit
MSKETSIPLEKSLEKLEVIVEKLESGETSLEKAITLYEEGRKLGAQCLAQLEGLEKRVQLVRETADGGLVSEPFDDEPVGEDPGVY